MPLFALHPPAAAPRPAPLHAQQRLSLPPREPGSSLWDAKPFQDAASHPLAARRGPVPSPWGCAVPGVRPQGPDHAWWDLPPARAQETQVYWGPKPRLCGCSWHKANCSVTHRGGAVTVRCSPGPKPCSPGEAREAATCTPAQTGTARRLGSLAWAGCGSRHQAPARLRFPSSQQFAAFSGKVSDQTPACCSFLSSCIDRRFLPVTPQSRPALFSAKRWARCCSCSATSLAPCPGPPLAPAGAALLHRFYIKSVLSPICQACGPQLFPLAGRACVQRLGHAVDLSLLRSCAHHHPCGITVTRVHTLAPAPAAFLATPVLSFPHVSSRPRCVPAKTNRGSTRS